MKYIFPTLVLAIVLSACGGPSTTEEVPQDLEGKKALLREKKQVLSELTAEITALEKEIASLDPNIIADNRTAVTATKLQPEDFEHFVEIQGTVQADDYIDVTSEIAGRILKMTVKEGDNVRQGQLIAELDLEQLKKQMAELETSLDLAKTVHERQKRLWDQNIGSEMQFLEAKNNKERLEKSIETLEYQLTKSKVYAPVSGVAESVILQSGELASPGAPIIQILNPNKLKVVADVPESYLKAVQPGKEVKVTFPALDQEQKARISLIGNTIDPNNRTLEVEANISKTNSLIKPNLLAVMYLQDYKEENVITVPIEVVQQEVGGKDFVFVTEEGAKGAVARKVFIKTGKSYGGEVIVEDGLDGGETLILDGAKGLAAGQEVKIKTSK
ncbi:MAG: efflux RND transporter periplasmic adaptor subunit [Chitinophagales bacterium]|nr:efflux RND transporter periplasmic adaptor subunit [Chitinophagales bacterium]